MNGFIAYTFECRTITLNESAFTKTYFIFTCQKSEKTSPKAMNMSTNTTFNTKNPIKPKDTGFFLKCCENAETVEGLLF